MRRITLRSCFRVYRLSFIWKALFILIQSLTAWQFLVSRRVNSVHLFLLYFQVSAPSVLIPGSDLLAVDSSASLLTQVASNSLDFINHSVLFLISTINSIQRAVSILQVSIKFYIQDSVSTSLSLFQQSLSALFNLSSELYSFRLYLSIFSSSHLTEVPT